MGAADNQQRGGERLKGAGESDEESDSSLIFVHMMINKEQNLAMMSPEQANQIESTPTRPAIGGDGGTAAREENVLESCAFKSPPKKTAMIIKR